jgi:hypothetical protein
MASLDRKVTILLKALLLGIHVPIGTMTLKIEVREKDNKAKCFYWDGKRWTRYPYSLEYFIKVANNLERKDLMLLANEISKIESSSLLEILPGVAVPDLIKPKS